MPIYALFHASAQIGAYLYVMCFELKSLGWGSDCEYGVRTWHTQVVWEAEWHIACGEEWSLVVGCDFFRCEGRYRTTVSALVVFDQSSLTMFLKESFFFCVGNSFQACHAVATWQHLRPAQC